MSFFEVFSEAKLPAVYLGYEHANLWPLAAVTVGSATFVVHGHTCRMYSNLRCTSIGSQDREVAKRPTYKITILVLLYL